MTLISYFKFYASVEIRSVNGARELTNCRAPVACLRGKSVLSQSGLGLTMEYATSNHVQHFVSNIRQVFSQD